MHISLVAEEINFRYVSQDFLIATGCVIKHFASGPKKDISTAHSPLLSIREHMSAYIILTQYMKCYINICCHWYFSSAGRAATSCTFVEYPHYPQQQKCSSSKWTSNSHVHCPSTIWRRRSSERGLPGSSGGM